MQTMAACIAILLATVVAGCESDQFEFTNQQLPKANLPLMDIGTPDQTDIGRSFVQHTKFTLSNMAGLADTVGEISIKGHGNSTWVLPKKPYSIVLTNQGHILGMQNGNQYVMLANYRDPTLMRNDVAMFMGREIGLMDYTPNCRFTDIIINGLYNGIYQISETPEGCFNNYDDGVILEIDGKAKYHDVTFQTTHCYHPFNIHQPEVQDGSTQWQDIKQWVQQAENAIYADNFTDSICGYRKYIDVMSFVEWFIINEIAKNYDAAFYTSCFMHYRMGGKISMGPIWDFDLAYGNYPHDHGKKVANSTDGFYIKNIPWYNRLFQDPYFVEMVKKRFNSYYNQRHIVYDHIKENCTLLQQRIALENKLWGQLCLKSSKDNNVQEQHRKEAEKLIAWIEARMVWLKKNIDEL